jgi:hypothetical protein
MADRCSFCGSTAGPFSKVVGLFTVLLCADCQAARGRGSGPYPVMTRAEMRAGLDLLPTWALEQKAAANRQLISAMRRRLAAGEHAARMYQEPGLAWLERQAEVAEELVAQRKPTTENRQSHDGIGGDSNSTSRVSFIRGQGAVGEAICESGSRSVTTAARCCPWFADRLSWLNRIEAQFIALR